MKLEIGRHVLDNVDVQAVEVPTGSKFLSVAGTLDVSSVVGLDGQRQATPHMSLCIGVNPEAEEKETFKVYIMGMGITNEIPDSAQFVGACSFANGTLVFHIFVDKM
jgi:predicted transcriptional regulator